MPGRDEVTTATSTSWVAGRALVDSEPRAALPYWDRLGRHARRVLGAMRGGRRHSSPPSIERRTAIGSADAVAARAQDIAGLGSGPYSGTPFPPAHDAADDAQQTTAAGEVSEVARHDHGIIDHSRHVSSVGRR